MPSLHDRLMVIDGLVFYSDGDARTLREGNVAAVNLTLRSPVDGFEQTFDAFAQWRARCADRANRFVRGELTPKRVVLRFRVPLLPARRDSST